MRYRRFGKTDRQLSLFSLGAMRLASEQLASEQSASGQSASGQSVSGIAAQQVIAEAIDRGINHIETAPAYGRSEQLIGRALSALQLNRGDGRAQLTITSKLTPTPEGAQIAPAIEASLDRLQVDYLDCLAIHGINTQTHLDWVTNIMLGAIAPLQSRGLVRHVGFSTHGPLALIQRAIATNAFSFINLHYNFFFQRNAPAIEQAHQQDMGIFIISPADKAGMLYTPPEQLKTLCAPFDPLLLNYRWLLSDPRITTLSVGPAVPAELAWPLEAADSDGPLTELERTAIERLNVAMQDRLGSDRCAQCDRCLPCPESINIPEVLRLRNLAVAYDMRAFGQYRYGMFENAGHWFPGRRGDRCTDCGDCLPRCPQQLDIPTLLRDTHNRLRGKQRRRLWED
ncbi:MAG: aldo/keto reductase [Cyanobacteria bacterium J06623_5]